MTVTEEAVRKLERELAILHAALKHIERVEPNGWGCYVREILRSLSHEEEGG